MHTRSTPMLGATVTTGYEAGGQQRQQLADMSTLLHTMNERQTNRILTGQTIEMVCHCGDQQQQSERVSLNGLRDTSKRSPITDVVGGGGDDSRPPPPATAFVSRVSAGDGGFRKDSCGGGHLPLSTCELCTTTTTGTCLRDAQMAHFRCSTCDGGGRVPYNRWLPGPIARKGPVRCLSTFGRHSSANNVEIITYGDDSSQDELLVFDQLNVVECTCGHHLDECLHHNNTQNDEDCCNGFGWTPYTTRRLPPPPPPQSSCAASMRVPPPPPPPQGTPPVVATATVTAATSPPYYRSSTSGRVAAAAAATTTTHPSCAPLRKLSARQWWWLLAALITCIGTLGVCVPIAIKISSSASLEERLEFANRLLDEVPLIDGHNDLPWNVRKFLHNRLKNFQFNEDLRNVPPWSTSAWSHTDLQRLRIGRVAAQFWAAYVPCDSQHKDAVQLTLEQIDVIRRLTDLYRPQLTLCTSVDDIKNAFERHQLCSMIGVEGGHSLAGSLAVLRTLYHVGVRYLTLTSTCNTPWADCSHEDQPGRTPEHGGLTSFGKIVIQEMNRLGMIVDLSHVSVGTMRDALDVSKAPVIFSHSSARALCNSTRNVPDATLRRLALNNGLIMVNFYAPFLTCDQSATIGDVVAHINHVRDVTSVDNVGLGAGYDGINFVPHGLEDVASYPRLFAELIATGRWSVDDLKKLAGLNFLRVLGAVERIRDEFRQAKVPPFEDVLVPMVRNNCTSHDHF